jgi:hypothetical protein
MAQSVSHRPFTHCSGFVPRPVCVCACVCVCVFVCERSVVYKVEMRVF